MLKSFEKQSTTHKSTIINNNKNKNISMKWINNNHSIETA